MVDLLERTATQVEAPPETTAPVTKVEERPPVRIPPEMEPSPFVRWMGWLLVLLVIAAVGVGAVLFWDNVIDTGPAIEALDPHVNPEISRVDRLALFTPSLESIDPRVSPEIVRLRAYQSDGPVIEELDPHESPEIVRIP